MRVETEGMSNVETMLYIHVQFIHVIIPILNHWLTS
jgi:hypothetical protein